MLQGEDRLLVLHNGGALDFELVAVDPAAPEGPGGWRGGMPHRHGARGAGRHDGGPEGATRVGAPAVVAPAVAAPARAGTSAALLQYHRL